MSHEHNKTNSLQKMKLLRKMHKSKKDFYHSHDYTRHVLETIMQFIIIIRKILSLNSMVIEQLTTHLK